MPRSILALRTTCAAVAGACALAHAASTPPPVAAVRPVAESYHGVTVTDGYRYMEDRGSPEVQQWARGQADAARSSLDAITGRATLLSRIRALDASVGERIVAPVQAGAGLVFFEKRSAGEERFKLYVRKGFKGEDRLLVDPDALGGAGPHAIEFFAPSNQGRVVAYGVSAGGSQEAVIHVMDVATGRELMAPVDRAQVGHVSWLADDSAFLYRRMQALPAGAPEADRFRNSGVWLHRMGGQGADTLVLGAGVNASLPVALEDVPSVQSVPGTRWMLGLSGNGVAREMALYAAPSARAPGAGTTWRKLFGRESEVTAFAVHGDDLYLLSHQGASRYKVLRTSMTHPDVVGADVVVAPGREVVDRIVAAKDALYVQAHDGGVGRLYRLAYARGAQPVPVSLPVSGALRIVDGDVRRPGVLVAVDSWTRAGQILSVGALDSQVADTGLQPSGPFGAPADLVAEEVQVRSHDGLEVPLSIVHLKGMKLDGSNPVELDAYGAFGVTDTPAYLDRQLAWYELGGVMATCHVRGGGIHGEQWHLAGKQLAKPNSWKDLVACGEYLVRKGYTSPGRLAIAGRGAGGIAVGRALSARPDLFAVVVARDGEFNTVRDELTANGPASLPEFGSVKDKAQFDALLEMDAFHHVEDGVKYPAALLLQGRDGAPVAAWASMKMAARLQAATTSGRPVLLCGPSEDGSLSQGEEADADLWSFMLWQFGDARFQPASR